MKNSPKDPEAKVFNYHDVPPITIGGTHNNMLSHVCIGKRGVQTENLQIDVHRYPQGGFSDANAHDQCEQAYFVLKGRGEAKIGGETKGVHPGSLVFIPRRTLHCIRNTGKGELVLAFISCNLG